MKKLISEWLSLAALAYTIALLIELIRFHDGLHVPSPASWGHWFSVHWKPPLPIAGVILVVILAVDLAVRLFKKRA